MKLTDYGSALMSGFGMQRSLGFHCPGCGFSHAFYVPRWTWNNSFTAPTFSPSLSNSWTDRDGITQRICHLYVEGGKIKYLGDCTHHLRGTTVEMEEVG